MFTVQRWSVAEASRSYNSKQSQLPEKYLVRAVPATRRPLCDPITLLQGSNLNYERLLLCLLRHYALLAGSEVT